MNWLDKIPFSLLIILSLTLGLAPFTPMPHLFEKISMLLAGELVRPIDVFDLLMHSSPVVLLLMKAGRILKVKPGWLTTEYIQFLIFKLPTVCCLLYRFNYFGSMWTMPHKNTQEETKIILFTFQAYLDKIRNCSPVALTFLRHFKHQYRSIVSLNTLKSLYQLLGNCQPGSANRIIFNIYRTRY